jgi:hypothetical protein
VLRENPSISWLAPGHVVFWQETGHLHWKHEDPVYVDLTEYLGHNIDDYAEFRCRSKLIVSNLSSSGASLSRVEPRLSRLIFADLRAVLYEEN